MNLKPHDPVAVQIVNAIHSGNIELLKQLLAENTGLAAATISNGKCSRSLLHISTDWPGHFPKVAETIKNLIDSGANVNARFSGGHTETPLHWAASSDDMEALDALLDAGADIEANGAVLGGGSPLSDAVGFRQWNAARRLVERGAAVTLSQAAALGMTDRVENFFSVEKPDSNEIDHAFWYACHGGQLSAAKFLLERGANVNWLPPWENLTPLDAAIRSGADKVADWLRSRSGRSAGELKGGT